MKRVHVTCMNEYGPELTEVVCKDVQIEPCESPRAWILRFTEAIYHGSGGVPGDGILTALVLVDVKLIEVTDIRIR